MRDLDGRTESKTTNRPAETGRRTFLKKGAIVGATAVSGSLVVGATGGRAESRYLTVHDGESAEVGDGTVTTAATTDSSGELVSLDVHVDSEALASVDKDRTKPHESVAAHLELPNGVDTHQFTFVGLHYNPVGHAPPGIYTVPHFDFHFYTVEESMVESIPFGMAAYDVPDEQFPPGYQHESPRLIVPKMGEHLLDGTAPEFGDGEFSHSYVYGIYDPAIDPKNPSRVEEVELEGEMQEVPVFEGDGQSRIHFVEPMVTNETFAALDGEKSVGVATPEAFPVAGRYPTGYVLRKEESGVTVSVAGFEQFPGASG